MPTNTMVTFPMATDIDWDGRAASHLEVWGAVR